MSFLAVGTVAFDAIETPFGKTDKIIGGAATYIGYAATYFTDSVNLVSVVGDDFPEEALQSMQKAGMDTRGIEVRQGERSFFWSGKYHMDMNTRETLKTELNVLADFNPELPASYRDANFVMLGNLTPQVQSGVIKQLTGKPELVAMDTMNFWIESEREALDAAIRQVDILLINDEEARQLTDEYSLVRAAQKILRQGPDYLVIKKGEHGALLFHKGDVFFAPALPLEEVYDPTGAGDSFAGGFMGYLSQSGDTSFENMKRAVIYGSAMASFCVEKFGTQGLQKLNPQAISNRITEFVRLSDFTIRP